MEVNNNSLAVIFQLILLFLNVRGRPTQIARDLLFGDEESIDPSEDFNFLEEHASGLEGLVSNATPTEFLLPNTKKTLNSKNPYSQLLSGLNFSIPSRSKIPEFNTNTLTGNGELMTPKVNSAIGFPGYIDGGNNLEQDVFETFQPSLSRLVSQRNSGRRQSRYNSFIQYWPQASSLVPDFSVSQSGVNRHLINQVPQNVITSGKLNLQLRSQFQKYDSNFHNIFAKLTQSGQDLATANNRISKVESDAQERTRLSNENTKEEFTKMSENINQINFKIENIENYAFESKAYTDGDIRKLLNYIKQLYTKMNDQEARMMHLIGTLKDMNTNPLDNGNPGQV